jgi:hypothetical protein
MMKMIYRFLQLSLIAFMIWGLFFIPHTVKADYVPPNPVVTLVKTGNTTATATWTDTGAYYYYIMISTSATFSAWSGGLGGSGPRSSYNFNGLNPNTTYYAFISSVNNRWEWNVPDASNSIYTGTTYTLSYSAGANGSVTGIVSQTVNSGSNGSAVTAVPNEGFHFENWSDSSTQNPRTDTNIAANLTVTANFAQTIYTINSVPVNVYVSLLTDLGTDVTSQGQIGEQQLLVNDTNTNLPVATLNINFNANLDWTNLSAINDGTKALFHYPGGFASLPGHSGATYSINIPDKGGNRVRICPNAVTLNDVSLTCTGGYYLTTSDSNVTRTNINGDPVWVVAGLSGSGGEDGGSGGGSAGGNAPLFTDLSLILTLLLSMFGGIKILSQNQGIRGV